LILDPQRILESQRYRQPFLLDHRRYAEAAAVDGEQRRVKFLHDLTPGRVGKTGGTRQTVRRQQRPIAQERISLASARKRRVGRLDDQHMINVIAGARMRAAERQNAGGIDRRAAAMTAEAHLHVHRPRFLPAPLLALNSAIIASQAGTNPSSWFQKDCLARAENSSTDTPCCSTQVK